MGRNRKRRYANRLEELCEANGILLTSKRKVICRVIAESDSHPDASMLYIKAKRIDPSIGIATVYRTLKLMKAKKVVDPHSFGQEHSHFESPAKMHHDHLICTRCGRIEEFHHKVLENIQIEVAKKHTFKMESHRLDLYGLCSDCIAAEGAGASKPRGSK
ncbi:MAG: transcriptional repressor [bacterium]|nr:MAG: transcriptional repressor [bacterium]